MTWFTFVLGILVGAVLVWGYFDWKADIQWWREHDPLGVPSAPSVSNPAPAEPPQAGQSTMDLLE